MKNIIMIVLSFYSFFAAFGQTPNRATTQDSLNVYNQVLKVLQHYRDKKYMEQGFTSMWTSEGSGSFTCEVVYKKDPEMFSSLRNAVDSFRAHKLSARHPTADGTTAIIGPIPLDTYFKKIDENKFYQRESHNNFLDTRAPMQLYDKRIEPTAHYKMASSDFMENNSGGWLDAFKIDVVVIHGYDPIAVKPESMLTAEERTLRDKRYGSKVITDTTLTTQKKEPTHRPPPNFKIAYPVHNDPATKTLKSTPNIAGHKIKTEIRTFEARTGKLLTIE